MNIGHRLHTLRTKHKFTPSIAQVALNLGISKQHLSNIEKGAKLPSLELLLKLADYYRVTVDDLMRGETEIVGSKEEVYVNNSVFKDLPPELYNAMETFADSLLKIYKKTQQRTFEDYALSMLGDIAGEMGDEATRELTDALNSFTDSGDSDLLRQWLVRYIGSENSLPD